MKSLIIHTIYVMSFFLLFHGCGQNKVQISDDNSYRFPGTAIDVQVPPGFTEGNGSHVFISKEKGTSLKLALVKKIPFERFCDSLTPGYFAAQQLQEMEISEQPGFNIYEGKFNIGKVPYIRGFYVKRSGDNTLIGIANYPEAMKEELGEYFSSMFNLSDHE